MGRWDITAGYNMKTKTFITMLLLGAASVCHGQYYPDGIVGSRVLDSIVTTYASKNMSKTIYETVSEKRLVYVYYRWNSQTHMYDKANKVDVSYYSKDKVGQSYSYNWDANTDTWVNSSKTDYSYDDNGNNTMWEELKWNAETSAWTKSKKVEYSFDANGNDTLSISYYGNAELNIWTNNVKIEKTYDETGNKIMSAEYGWNGEMWAGFSFGKHVYAYDENNRIVAEDVYDWNNETNSYELANKYKTQYLGNIGGKPTQIFVFIWQETRNVWERNKRNTYMFDAAGNILSVVSCVYNAGTYGWDNDFEYTYEYDSNGKMISEQYSRSWSIAENQWTDGYSVEFEYDIYGYKTLEAHYSFSHSPQAALHYYYSDGKIQSAVLNLPVSDAQTSRFIRDGQLLILRDGKTYNVQGQELR